MSLARVTNWTTGQVLTAAALNAEFNNILNNPASLIAGATLTSNLIFTDATYDIGQSGATRPRHLYLSGDATIGGLTSGRLPTVSTAGLLVTSGSFLYADTSLSRTINITASASTSAAFAVANTHASGNAFLSAGVSGTGDAFLLTTSDGASWYTGVDSSASDQFIIGTGLPGSADKFIISTAGDVKIPGLAGAGSRTVVADANGVLSAP